LSAPNDSEGSNKKLKIIIASDHAGFAYKARIVEMLRQRGHEVSDAGAHTAEASDYPLWIIPAVERVAAGEFDFGIVLGGSGNGEAIAANKVHGIRCALCWSPETAELARSHNDANVLALGERLVDYALAERIIETFLATPFSGHARHARRLAQLAKYEIVLT